MSQNVSQSQVAASILQGLGIHQTPGAVKALVGWMAAEGGHWHNDAKYNPLNTTQVMPGAGNTGTQGNIKVYKNWQQGIEATVKTLQYGAYKGIRSALASGNADAVANAIGKTPWGTNAALVKSAISGTKTISGAEALASSGSASRAAKAAAGSTTTTGGGTTTDTKAAILDSLMSPAGSHGGFSKDILSRLTSGKYTKTEPVTTTTTVDRAAKAASGASSSKGLGPLRELFWQGQNGIDVKNGQKQAQGFVSGHTDHVHVASGPKTVTELGKLAQSMGLHVGENPNFGGVNPVHVKGSYHYKGEAIDVSGDAKLMAHFAATVAHKYGLKVKG